MTTSENEDLIDEQIAAIIDQAPGRWLVAAVVALAYLPRFRRPLPAVAVSFCEPSTGDIGPCLWFNDF